MFDECYPSLAGLERHDTVAHAAPGSFDSRDVDDDGVCRICKRRVKAGRS